VSTGVPAAAIDAPRFRALTSVRATGAVGVVSAIVVVAAIVVVLIMTVFRLESTQSQRGACHCKQNFLPHLFPPETASFGGLERPYNKS